MAEPQEMKASMLHQLRASDAERAEAADLLTKHFTAGRLDRAELDQRLGVALTAKTRGELTALLFDLPRIAATRSVPAQGRRARRHRSPLALLCLLGCLVIVAASSLTTSVRRAAVAHAGIGGQQVIIHSQRVFSVAPVLVAVLLVAMVCLAVGFLRRNHEVED